MKRPRVFQAFLVISLVTNICLGIIFFAERSKNSNEDVLAHALSEILEIPEGEATGELPFGYYLLEASEEYPSLVLFKRDHTMREIRFTPIQRWKTESPDTIVVQPYLQDEYHYFGNLRENRIYSNQGDYDNIYRRLDISPK